MVEGCADSLDRYGFCVIDNLIPSGEVDAIREEVEAARLKIERNHRALQELARRGVVEIVEDWRE